jgi:UDP-N-acetylglucosamine 1-carboxyvinyltransferase
MNAFEIVGGKPLKGEIIPQGAKNEALQIISAVLLTEEKITISNIPDIKDVNKLIELVADLGVKVERINQDTYTFEASKINLDFFQSEAFRAKGGSLRGSIMIVGPLLARFGKAAIPKPGGDKIGRRRLDTHFLGFEKLGAKFIYDNKTNFFNVDASDLKGAYILLDEASVTGTANVVMAAVLAKGETTIYNAACEPYLQQLCKIGLAAMTESEITIKNVRFEELGMIPEVFRKLGIKFELRGDDIFIPSQKHYEVDTFIDGSIMTIADAPWPGFTPDLLSIMLVIATQAKGNVLIHQKMFESRLFFVDKLIDMGAQIILCDPHRATVIGLDKKVKLRGIEMTSPDIRAGVSLLIAALSAQGTSIIYNIEQIERGYQNIDTRLKALGADIKRINVTNKTGH